MWNNQIDQNCYNTIRPDIIDKQKSTRNAKKTLLYKEKSKIGGKKPPLQTKRLKARCDTLF